MVPGFYPGREPEIIKINYPNPPVKSREPGIPEGLLILWDYGRLGNTD